MLEVVNGVDCSYDWHIMGLQEASYGLSARCRKKKLGLHACYSACNDNAWKFAPMVIVQKDVVPLVGAKAIAKVVWLCGLSCRAKLQSFLIHFMLFTRSTLMLQNSFGCFWIMLPIPNIACCDGTKIIFCMDTNSKILANALAVFGDFAYDNCNGTN